MDGISSIPLEDSVAFLKLRDQYKTSLLEDSRLNKAAGLAAQQELLLNSPADAAWKVPRLKSVNKQLRVWSQKIRQPGLPTGPGSPEEDEEANLAIGPTQKFMGHIAQLKQRIKRPAATPPAVPLVTPKLEKPSTSQSAPSTLGFKTKPYKPYKKKSSGTKSKTPVYESDTEFDTAAEDVLSPLSKAKASAKAYGKAKAQAVIASVKEKAKQKAKEYALKKLQPYPGWEPFGGKPLKRKLHGKDWTASPKGKGKGKGSPY